MRRDCFFNPAEEAVCFDFFQNSAYNSKPSTLTILRILGRKYGKNSLYKSANEHDFGSHIFQWEAG